MNTINDKEILTNTDPSSYSRVFDETNVNWERQPEYCMLFLKTRENYFNDLLRSRGHVFLNDVYDGLGFKRTSAGQIVGWLVAGKGANYIDFGIRTHRIDHTTTAVLLEFNIDGIIYDKID